MDANVDVLAYMELISNTGFPIVIAMYLLHRMEQQSTKQLMEQYRDIIINI